MHYAPDYLLNPQHPLTVCVIGCGGTGTQVLSILARFNEALLALDHQGLHVTVFDDDKITEANVGRQLYSHADIGQYKSIVSVSRLNRFFGTTWDANPNKFYVTKTYNIYITCVDDYDTRLTIGKKIKNERRSSHQQDSLYWLDFGNSNNSGQAILGSLLKKNTVQNNILLPCFDQWAKLYPKPKKSDNTPSCSLAEALDKQDLMINSTLANAGMQLLWRLLREGQTPYRGIILNLETMNLNPILV